MLLSLGGKDGAVDGRCDCGGSGTGWHAGRVRMVVRRVV